MTSGLTILGLMQPRVKAKFRLRVLRWHGSSRRSLPKMQTWSTVMTGVCPSFRVGVSFRPILLCLILN